MDKLSGLVLDLYDDGGKTAAAAYGAMDRVPAHIKEAHVLTEAERVALPDDLFALVLQAPDGCLRKYACTDAGHTAMNALYLLQHGDKLPPEAQKVAAANIVRACGWYGLEPPEAISKLAGLGTLANVAMSIPDAISTKKTIKANMAQVKQAPQVGGVTQIL